MNSFSDRRSCVSMAASMSSLLILIPDSDPHERLLRPLHNLAILLQEVRALQGLEHKILILEVPIIEESRAHLVLVLHHNVVVLFRNHRDTFPRDCILHVVQNADGIGKLLLCLLVEI